MSYIFDHEDEVVRSPALRVGRTYVGLTRAASAVLSVPDGLSPMASDYYYIDGDRFGAFVAAMVDLRSSHTIAHSLLDGVYLTSLVMLNRMAPGSVQHLDAAAGPAVEQLARAMPVL